MKKEAFRLIAVLLLGLGLKLLCLYLEPTISRDGCFYIHLARSWHGAGDFQTFFKACPEMLWIPPLPVYLMTCLMSLGFSAETAGILLNVICGTFIPLWTYGIAREVIRKNDVAFCAALLAAVHPSLNVLSIQVQRDMIYISLTGAALWLITAGLRRQIWWLWAGAGLLCGCAMLSRYETVEFMVIVPAVLLFLCCAKHLIWKRGAVYCMIFFCCFAGCIGSLSALMQTRNYLYPNYQSYYQEKLDGVMQKFKNK